MRRLMIAPTLLLMGSALPPAPVPMAPLGRWCGGDASVAPQDRPTVLLPGYGQSGFKITTKNPQAQAFFDNGMQLAHAFSHKAAVAAFQQARKLDPECAMCAWGEAWATGPTINFGVSDEQAKKLAGIVAEAETLAANATPRERNLIGALKQRYPASGKGGNAAFAAAMEQMVTLAPDDDAILTITADAHMIATDIPGAESMARPVALLETVLKRNPDYAPAIHFYIHATEGAGYPQRAERYADQLARIAPAASHLVHMPSHTYYWIGRYADAATSNVGAVELGKANAAAQGLTGPDGVWTLGYHAHNVHFGLGGALMSGDAENGLALARPVVGMASRTAKLDDFRQYVAGMAYIAIARFGPDGEMMAVNQPAADKPVARAMWHYARGEAFARQGDVAGVLAEARAMPARFAGTGFVAQLVNPIYSIASLTLQGRAAMLKGDPARAAKFFERAAAIEESKPLTDMADPPMWWYPVRRDLAAALFAKGDAAGALAAVDASLKFRPLDPVALKLRAEVQDKLGNAAAAAQDLRVARAGWRGGRIG